VIASTDNFWRLSGLLDPLRNPLLRTPRRLLRGALTRLALAPGRQSVVQDSWHTRSEVDGALRAVGLEPEIRLTVGFGPFTLFNREFLPQPVGAWLDRQLRALADRGAPGLRWMGTNYLVVARKSL
jgi:hypothetical protein